MGKLKAKWCVILMVNNSCLCCKFVFISVEKTHRIQCERAEPSDCQKDEKSELVNL